MRLYVIILFIISQQVFSQNLIENPSFENLKTKCINRISLFNNTVYHWNCASFGTTDIFNPCAKRYVGVPKNYNGSQIAKDGNNYAGCYFYSKDFKNYREYIQGKLKSTLIKGKTYELSFYISLADISDIAINNISFYLSNRNVTFKTFDVIKKSSLDNLKDFNYTFYYIPSNDFYTDKINWIKISKRFIAKGFENFITIGNFDKNRKIEKLKVKQKDMKIAYYYIDLVSIVSLDVKIFPKKTIKPKPIKKDVIKNKPLDIKLNKVYIFKNVTFDFNKIILKEKAKKEIANIYSFLKENKNTHIIISGHTDNIGSDKFNNKLSIDRAKSVSDYFIFLGLDKSRISTKGYGKTKPLVNNNNQTNRSKNRRVSFEIKNL